MSTDLDKARRAASQDRDPDAYVVRLRDLRVALTEVDRLTADLSALRIEHTAWGALLDVTRKDRDALRARVAELERAANAARKVERADVMAYLDRRTGDIDDHEAFALVVRLTADIERGAHEGAAGVTK